MKLLLLTLLASTCAFGQGYSQLSNTALRVDNTTSVCPVNGFNAGVGGMPNYAFRDNCPNVINAWSSAVADTKRNCLWIWGGGHVAYYGNEMYSLCLTQTLTGYKARTNSSVPTMQRMTDPSVFTTDCQPNADGTPLSLHTWGGLVWLPRTDAVFEVDGRDYCDNEDKAVHLFSPSTLSWSTPTMSGVSDYSSVQGAYCDLNPIPTNESVICIIGNNDLIQFDMVANSKTRLVAYGTNITQTGGTVVVDPDRKILFEFGPDFSATPGSGKIYGIELTSGSYTMTDYTSTYTGCSELIAYPYPSLKWDPSLHRIVGYVPRTAASSSASNQVFIVDPGMKTCVTVPLTGGPSASAAIRGTVTAAQGMFGRFNYFPGLGKYALTNDPAGDSYTFQLSLTPQNGLASSTLTCLDLDGDGYGVGAGCTGVDADDRDSAVHTSAQLLSKWTTLTGYFNSIGYAPANIWYVATTGNNGTGVVNDSTHPFATCCGSGKANPAAGDMVLYRGGTYTDIDLIPPTGTAGHPIYLGQYPGEQWISTSPVNGYPSIDITASNYVVIDGLKVMWGTGSLGCIGGGVGTTNIEIRHVEGVSCKYGISSGDQPVDWVIEDTVFHDASEQHGIYLTSHYSKQASNIFVHRNILYSNPYNGFQYNGKVVNLILEQNIMYSNASQGISLLEGINNSYIRSNLVFNNGGVGLTINDYDGDCSTTGQVCPFDQTGNLIENNTFWVGSTAPDGSDITTFPTIQISNTTTSLTQNLGGNLFKNNILFNYGTSNHYPPFEVWQTTRPTCSTQCTAWIKSTSFINNILYQGDGNNGTGVIGIGAGSGFGLQPYTCAQWVTFISGGSGTVSGCVNSNPQFTASSFSYNTTPASFNLSLQNTSPGIGVGSPVIPMFDVYGNTYLNAPVLGSIQSNATTTSGSVVSGAVKFSGSVVVH